LTPIGPLQTAAHIDAAAEHLLRLRTIITIEVCTSLLTNSLLPRTLLLTETRMKTLVAIFVFLVTVFQVHGQESINAHEGFDVGKQAGLALTICFAILAAFTLTINVIKRKCVKMIP